MTTLFNDSYICYHRATQLRIRKIKEFNLLALSIEINKNLCYRKV